MAGTALSASLAGEWTPQHLGLEQLIKHALALSSHKNDRSAHLIYAYREPENASDIPEVISHRNELAQLVKLLGTAEPRLHALSYHDLLAEWSALPDPGWIHDHISELARRYELTI